MKNKGIKVGFIKNAINSLSQEQFNTLVRIFQESYWECTDIVGVDGSGDGGCDIKIYVNKKELKKCVQITVQKTLDYKINNDLKKTKKLVEDFGYYPSLEFYCNISVSNSKIEQYKKDAKINYGIELDMFDATRIAELGGVAVEDYIYGLHSDIVVKPHDMTFEKSTRYLYDLLASGTASSDIKNSILESVLISIVYEKEVIEVSSLRAEVERRLGKNLSDITPLINSLKSDQRIIKDSDIIGAVRLSEEERRSVKDIYANSMEAENNFNSELNILLAKYHINNIDHVYTELKKLYSSNYSDDSKENDINEDNWSQKSLDVFKKNIIGTLQDKNDVDSFVIDIKHLCDSNNYMNKIIAGETFINLYKSNKLGQYLNQKQKAIFLDTPTFIYYICSIYGFDLGVKDWDDPFYRSMKSLITLQKSRSERIVFYVMEDYLYEIANEIKKALQLSRFEQCSFLKDLGSTRNTIFNYYCNLRDNNLFDVDDNIESVEDFLALLGFENTDYLSSYFINNTLRNLREFAEDYHINVASRPSCEYFNDATEAYSKKIFLLDKEKSNYAINNDVNQIVAALEFDKYTECYVASWDTTLGYIKEFLMNLDSHNQYSFCRICNPARLSNRLALENFDIDSSALTNDIFAYADRKYDISKKVKTLLEMIAPFIKGEKLNDKLLRKLATIRKAQCEKNDNADDKLFEDRSLPIEEALSLLIPNRDAIKNDSSIVDKFTLYINSEENSDYIIEVIERIMKEQNYKTYDLSDYWEKVKEVQL